MKHLKKGRKFGRKRGQRKALMSSLASSLIHHERIDTTEAKAKELKSHMGKLVTIGKKQEVSALRRLMKKLPKDAAYKMYHVIAPRYEDRNGGYTRIIKHAKRRKQDGAKKATIEFV